MRAMRAAAVQQGEVPNIWEHTAAAIASVLNRNGAWTSAATGFGLKGSSDARALIATNLRRLSGGGARINQQVSSAASDHIGGSRSGVRWEGRRLVSDLVNGCDAKTGL